MNKFKFLLIGLFVLVRLQTNGMCFADSVTLKNGSIFDGKIAEVRKDYLKIDIVEEGGLINCVLKIKHDEISDWKIDDRFKNLKKKEISTEVKEKIMQIYMAKLEKREALGAEIIYEERQDRRVRAWRKEEWDREDYLSDKAYRREKERFGELKDLVMTKNLENKDLVGDLIKGSGVKSGVQGADYNSSPGYGSIAYQNAHRNSNPGGACRWDPGDGGTPGQGKTVRTAGWVGQTCRIDAQGKIQCSCE